MLARPSALYFSLFLCSPVRRSEFLANGLDHGTFLQSSPSTGISANGLDCGGDGLCIKKLPEENYRFEVFKKRIPESMLTEAGADARTDAIEAIFDPKHPPKKNKNIDL